jgi:hypothetical protein
MFPTPWLGIRRSHGDGVHGGCTGLGKKGSGQVFHESCQVAVPGAAVDIARQGRVCMPGELLRLGDRGADFKQRCGVCPAAHENLLYLVPCSVARRLWPDPARSSGPYVGVRPGRVLPPVGPGIQTQGLSRCSKEGELAHQGTGQRLKSGFPVFGPGGFQA